MFRVGQRVRIREWDEMEQEFGLTDNGISLAPCVFTTVMRPLCGKIFTVSGHRYGRNGATIYSFVEPTSYSISEEMLKPVDTLGFKVGDWVRIKSWKKMAKEYPECSTRIELPGFHFTEYMKKFCGLVGKIDYFRWSEQVGCVYAILTENPVLNTIFLFSPYMFERARRIV